MSKPITIDEMSQHILQTLKDVTADFPEDEQGRAQANVLAAFFGGTVVEVKQEPSDD